MEPKHVQLNEIDVAYIEAGSPDAPLALCFHGFPDHAHSFDALLPALADAGYHAVAPWLRGYAPTGLAPDGNYELPILAVDAVELTDALSNGKPAALVGHDWGATVVYGAAAMQPDKYSRAVTMAVPHPFAFAPIFLTDYEQQKRSFYMFVFQVEGLAEGIVAADDFAFIDKLITDWSPNWERGEADRDHLRAAIGAPENLTAALSYYRQMMPTNQSQSPEMTDLRARTAAPIAIPTLQLFGVDDGCIDPAILGDQSGFFTGGLEVELVAGCGHFLLQDDPGTIVSKIVDWLGPPEL